MWLFNLFKNNIKKDKEIEKLNEEVIHLRNLLDKDSQSDIYDFKNDFLFNNVDKVISIEGEVHDQLNLIKCTICYMLIEIDSDEKQSITYKEWYTWCTIKQYKYLYDEFIKYKESLNA